MAGFPFDAANINGKVGQLAMTLMDGFDEAQRLKIRCIDDFANQAAFVAATGLVDADATQIRAVLTAFDTLARVARGQATQPAASDFFFDARKLRGTN